MIHELVKQNQEFKDLLIQQSKQMIEQTKTIIEVAKNSQHIHTTNNNNTFNLNIFLNEDCKDAMNIIDFVNSLQYRISNLDYIGQAGYVEGVSKIILDGLKEMEVTKRPIHCTDAKRNSLYLRYDDQWNKESCDMQQMKTVIRSVAHKSIQKIPDWQKNHPGHTNPSTSVHKEYISIVNNAMGGATDEEDTNNYKNIIHKVSNAVALDKDNINVSARKEASYDCA